jgi:hypothetical protein
MRGAIVLALCAACGDSEAPSDASFDTLVGHWMLLPSGPICRETMSFFA